MTIWPHSQYHTADNSAQHKSHHRDTTTPTNSCFTSSAPSPLRGARLAPSSPRLDRAGQRQPTTHGLMRRTPSRPSRSSERPSTNPTALPAGANARSPATTAPSAQPRARGLTPEKPSGGARRYGGKYIALSFECGCVRI